MKNSSRILVIGSLNTDLVVRTPRMPRPGENIMGKSFDTVPGGKGANQAVAAARLGADVAMVGSVGNDAFGDFMTNNLEAEGIDVSRILRKPDYKSGVAFIFVDDTGENSIVVAPGSNMALTSQDVEAFAGDFSSFDAVITQLEIPKETVSAVLRLCASKNVPCIFNPAPATQFDLSSASPDVILTPNEYEASVLTGVPVEDAGSALEAARALQSYGPSRVIITLGSRGVLACDGDESVHIPAYKVDPVDTTAAGDSFTGAFTVALSSGKNFLDACRFASAAAALAVTRLGAQPSLPTLEEVQRFLQEQTETR